MAVGVNAESTKVEAVFIFGPLSLLACGRQILGVKAESNLLHLDPPPPPSCLVWRTIMVIHIKKYSLVRPTQQVPNCIINVLYNRKVMYNRKTVFSMEQVGKGNYSPLVFPSCIIMALCL